jgi:hypothetical protein
MGYTVEKGSRAHIHVIAAGKGSHGKYVSECQFEQESQFVRSEKGRCIQEKVWKDLMSRIGRISPEFASFVC